MLFRKNEDSIWQSISDIMTGLMVIFSFICVCTLAEIDKQKNNYNTIKNAIYNDLLEEFKPEELSHWGTEINPDNLTVMFTAPRVLFGMNERTINSHFKEVLKDFFPRYISVLKKHDADIVEIRIEGNASKDFNGDMSSNDAYFYNMQLSQARAFSVLKYVYSLEAINPHKEFMRKKLRANGASFSKANSNRNESSRYVEISIQRNAEKELEKLNGKN